MVRIKNVIYKIAPIAFRFTQNVSWGEKNNNLGNPQKNTILNTRFSQIIINPTFNHTIYFTLTLIPKPQTFRFKETFVGILEKYFFYLGLLFVFPLFTQNHHKLIIIQKFIFTPVNINYLLTVYFQYF